MSPAVLPDRRARASPTTRRRYGCGTAFEATSLTSIQRARSADRYSTDAVKTERLFCFLLDLRALLRCFFPGGPAGLPDGVLASPGFFFCPVTSAYGSSIGFGAAFARGASDEKR